MNTQKEAKKKAPRVVLTFEEKVKLADAIKSGRLDDCGSWKEAVVKAKEITGVDCKDTHLRHLATSLDIDLGSKFKTPDSQLTEIQQLIAEQRKTNKLLTEISITLSKIDNNTGSA